MGKEGGTVLTAALLVLALALYVPQLVAQATEDPCSAPICQQGTCVSGGIFGHTCNCQEGWENILNLPFLPCGIPKDCHVNLTCDGSAGSPPPPTPTFSLPNLTAFDPCTFNLCGFGKCVGVANPGLLTVPYSCVCDPGNSNVMNVSSGTCRPDCNFDGSCLQLGIPLTKPSTPPSTITNADSPSAGLYPPGDTSDETGQPPNAGIRSREVATFLASATVGTVLWLWV